MKESTAVITIFAPAFGGLLLGGAYGINRFSSIRDFWGEKILSQFVENETAVELASNFNALVAIVVLAGAAALAMGAAAYKIGVEPEVKAGRLTPP